jgi:hypothetical protein
MLLASLSPAAMIRCGTAKKIIACHRQRGFRQNQFRLREVTVLRDNFSAIFRLTFAA